MNDIESKSTVTTHSAVGGGGQQGRRYKLQTENSSDTHTHCRAAVAAGTAAAGPAVSCSHARTACTRQESTNAFFYLGHSLTGGAA